MKITTIERHRLSDDTLVILKKVGRKYMVIHTWLNPVEGWYDLTKAEAYDIIGDLLENDVMDRL